MSGDPHTVRQIGRYEIIRKIATGGMAELFLARFVGPGGFEKRCALKRILPQFATDQVFTRMFLNEARVTAMFDHPNLVQIFELGQDDDGQFFIAMELVNGINLRQLLQLTHERGLRIPPELAAFMVTQALDGLAYAHDFRDPDGRALNLVHRDISPQNILVSYDGWVKLVDFGIVKGNSISSETQAGMLKGKVAYMSPEQATGEHIDGRSDLFSLGVCFYELVAQERPFQAINEIMTLKAILEQQPPPITAYVPDIAEGLESAIERALEKLPSDRFSSAREFQEHLHHVLRGCPTPIGRHTLAEFIGSLTEGTTSSFDSTRVRIPRGAAGFGHSLASSPESSGPKPLNKTPPPRRIGPPTDPKAQARRSTGTPDAPTPTPMDQARTMDGMTAEVRAAGLNKSGINPLAIGVFIASALAGAVVVFLAMRPTEVVPLVVAPAPVSVPTPTPTPPPVAIAPPPPVAVAPPPPTPTPPPAEVAPPPAETPPPPERKDDEPRRKKRDRDDREKDRDRDDNKPHLNLDSAPAGLTVKLEGKVLGKTPLSVALKPGTHRLTLTGTKFGVTRQVTVEVPKTGSVTEKVTLKRGSVRVLVRPAAEVFVNNIPMGKAPPLSFELYEGDYTLRLVTDDGSERSQPLRISAGQEELVKVIF